MDGSRILFDGGETLGGLQENVVVIVIVDFENFTDDQKPLAFFGKEAVIHKGLEGDAVAGGHVNVLACLKGIQNTVHPDLDGCFGIKTAIRCLGIHLHDEHTACATDDIFGLIDVVVKRDLLLCGIIQNDVLFGIRAMCMSISLMISKI